MPNQTLYDNFSQIRQYIDQEKPDLSSYVTKTELSGCGYLTSIPSEYITQQELSANSYATTSELSSYLPLTGGTLTGDLTISNTYVLTLGTERPWQIYETGTGGGAYIVMKGGSNKKFYIADQYTNPIIEHLSNNSSSNYVKIHTDITYTNNILPNTNNYYKLGNNNYQWSTIYTKNVNIDSSIKLWQASTNEMDITLSNTTYYFFNNERFAPSTAANHNKLDLGKSDRSWKATYTSDLYLNGTNIIDTINGIFSYDSSTGTLSITTIS